MQRQGFRPRPANIGDYVATVRLEVACQLGLRWVSLPAKCHGQGSTAQPKLLPIHTHPTCYHWCLSTEASWNISKALDPPMEFVGDAFKLKQVAKHSAALQALNYLEP